MDWMDEVRRVLQWLEEEEAFREFYFRDPEAALEALEAAGQSLSDFARRTLLERITADTFAEEYERFMDVGVTMGEAAPDVSEALPLLDYPQPARVVSTGFAAPETPDAPLDRERPLSPQADYFFWLEVGERVAGSIETADHDLPLDKLPETAVLDVVLYAFGDGLQLTPGADSGQLQVQDDGTVRVARRVAAPAAGDLLERRLFFPVRAGARGVHRLRCNIYYRQNLVQSRLITARVGEESDDGPALRAELDYTLSRSLDGAHLQGMGTTRLSVMLNDNGNGTHGFRFFGEEEFRHDTALGEMELMTQITKARGALRQAMWGDEDPYKQGKKYRYYGELDEAQLAADLKTMALRGSRFYVDLIGRLAGSVDKAWELADLMRQPGQVQIASKESSRLVVPVSLFYDYELDDGKPLDAYEICPTFMAAVHDGTPLADTDCFQGNCPSADFTTVCPSGFWGFRHAIGLPVSVRSAPEAPVAIVGDDKGPKVALNVATSFALLETHEQALEAMDLHGERADSRDEALDNMKRTKSEVVYFYCHGGAADGMPFLNVGDLDDDWLTATMLFQKRIRWREKRPLVFINGCHTTNLTPEIAMDFVNAFVSTSHAAGVIGTEITIFEPLAVAFAETFFNCFLRQGQTVGEAIRSARLELLGQGNPLGLVYIPFALPGLQLSKTSADG